MYIVYEPRLPKIHPPYPLDCDDPTCTYDRQNNNIQCTFPGMAAIRCPVVAKAGGRGKLPAGCYRIGNFYTHRGKKVPGGVPWYNLYRQKDTKDGWWDYYTDIPEIDCRGFFGLHFGTKSLGCITVTDRQCFNNLMNAIKNNHPDRRFEVHKCRLGCRKNPPACIGGTVKVSQLCTTDLKVV